MRERPLKESIKEVARQAGLEESTVHNLLQAGWKFEQKEGEPSRWVSPEAQMPRYIPHDEPWCNACLLHFPHKHGLSCTSSCRECHGVCHPDCPAYQKET